MQVLQLQLAIEELTAEHNNQTIGLRDICFAPLAPENQNCTISSVLNYFQNSEANLDKVDKDFFYTYADYMDHIMACTR